MLAKLCLFLCRIFSTQRQGHTRIHKHPNANVIISMRFLLVLITKYCSMINSVYTQSCKFIFSTVRLIVIRNHHVVHWVRVNIVPSFVTETWNIFGLLKITVHILLDWYLNYWIIRLHMLSSRVCQARRVRRERMEMLAQWWVHSDLFSIITFRIEFASVLKFLSQIDQFEMFV